MSKKLLIFLASCSLQLPSMAQVEAVQPDAKLLKYHTVLLKRPESTALFQRFQTAWLAQYPEQTLEKFLREQSVDSAEGKQLLAYYLLQKGSDIEASKVLSKAIAEEAGNPQLLVDRARAYARLLEFNKALMDLDGALKLAGDDESLTLTVNKLKGRYLTRQGKTDEAVAHWQKLVKENPQDQELSEDVIDILMADSLAPSAVKLARDLRDNTKDPYKRALRTLRISDILVKQGLRDEALETLDTTLELSGASSWLEREILGQIQAVYKREDNLVGLTTHLEKLSKAYPQRAALRLKLAEAFGEAGDYEKAKTVYRDLLKVSPNDEVMRTAYLQLLMRSGDYMTARQLIDSMLKNNPTSPELHLHRASLSHQLKDKEGTIKSLDSYKSNVAKSHVSSLKYAELLKKYGHDAEAVAAYKSVITEFPDSIVAQFKVADFLFLSGDKDGAKELWLSIAKKADKTNIVTLLEKLVQSDQLKLASEIVAEHRDQFKTNAAFLISAIQVSERNKQLDIAQKDAKSLVILSTQPIEIDSAIATASRIIGKSSTADDEVKLLKAKATRTVSEEFLLANLYELIGDVKNSNEIITGLASSEDPVALLQTARIYERRFQLSKAAETMEKLITLAGQLKATHLRHLSQIYQRGGNGELALSTIQKWKKLAPNDKQVWLAEVSLLEQVKGSEAALESLRKGAQKFENDTEIYAKLADLNLDLGHYSQAILLYWRLYDDSNDMTSQIRWASELARAHQNDGRMSDLVDELNTRRRNSPKAIAPIMALAEVYRVNDQMEERRNLLLEATRLRPDEVGILYEIASIDHKEGDQSKAIDILRKAQKLDKTGTATKKLAQLLLEEGNFEEGLRELTSLGDGKDDARTVESIALSLISQQAHDEAKVYLAKHLLEHPEDWRLKFIDCLLDYELGYAQRSFDTALALLDESTPLKNITTGWQANVGANGGMIDFKVLPKAYQTYFVLPTGKQMLDQFILGGGNMYSSYSYRNNAGLVGYLPRDEDSLKVLVYAQLVNLLDEFAPKEQAEKIKIIEQAGHKQMALYTELLNDKSGQSNGRNFGMQEGADGFLKKALVKYPDDKFLNNLQMLQLFSQMQTKLPKEQLDKLLKWNKEEPDSYLYEIASVFTDEESKPEDYLKELLAEIKKAKEVSDVKMMAVMVASQHYFMDKDSGMPKEVADVYLRYQEESKTKVSSNAVGGAYGYNVSAYVEQALKFILFMGDDYEKIVKELEKTQSQGRQYYRDRTAAFPPRGLSSVNEAQLGLLSKNQYGGPSLKPKRVGESLNLFKNPVLRLIAKHYADPKADLLPDIEKLKGQENYAADGHLLHAGLLLRDGKPLKLRVEQMEMARAKSVSKVQRQELDQTILAAALSFKTGEEFSKELSEESQESIRGTARRMLLSRAITDPTEINNVLEKLGMQAESARFLTKDKQSIRKAIVAKGGLTGMVMSSSGTVPRRTNNTTKSATLADKLKKAQQKNNDNLAITLLETELKKQLKSNNGNYELEQTKSLIQRAKLGGKILEKFHPRDSTSPRRWLSYYQVAKLLENAQAQQLSIDFLGGLTHVPSQGRTPLALAIYSQKPAKALDLLKKSRDLSPVVSKLMEDFNSVKSKPVQYLAVMEFSEKFLAEVDPESAAASQVSQNLDSMMSTYLSVSSAYYRDNKRELNAVKGKLAVRRETAFKGLLEQCLKFGSTSDHAFKLLQHFDGEKAKHVDQFIAYAKSGLLSAGNGKPDIDYVNPTIYNENAGRIDYLVKHILNVKNTDALDDEYLKQLSLVNPQLGANLSIIKRYLLADEAGLLAGIKSIKHSDDLVIFTHWKNFLMFKGSAKVKLEYAKVLLDYMEHIDEQDHEYYRMIYTSLQSNPNNAMYGDGFLKDEISSIIPILFENSQLNKLINLNDGLAKKILEGATDKQKVWKQHQNTYSYTAGGFRVILFKALSRQLSLNPLTHVRNADLLAKHEYVIDVNRYSGYNNDDVSDSLIESLVLAKILTSVDEIKLEKLSKKTEKKEDMFMSGSSSLTAKDKQFDQYVIQVVASDFSSYQKRENFKLRMASVPKKQRYGAQLLLAVSDNMDFDDFIRQNVKDIRKASKEHKLALAEIFDLKNQAKHRSFLKSNNFGDLLPMEKSNLDLKSSPETVQFLSRTKPFVQNEFYAAETFIKEYIQNNVYTDLETTYKVLGHYVTLLEKSKGAGQAHYKTSADHSNFIQVALTDNVFDSLKRQKVDQHLLLRLAYRLTKHPLHNKIGFRLLIATTMPANWHQSVPGKKGLPAVEVILLGAAKKYKALKNEDEKAFFKAAWGVYFTSYEWYQKLHFEIGFKHDFVHGLVEKYPKHNEFFEMVDLLRKYEFYPVNYALYSSTKGTNLRKQAHTNQDWYRSVNSPELVKFVSSLPPYCRVIYLSALTNNKGFLPFLVQDEAYVPLCVNSLSDAVEADADIGYSNDSRYLLMLYKDLGEVDEKLKEKWMDACETIVLSLIQHIDERNMIHQNHFINACLSLAINDEGAKRLDAIYQKHPEKFLHLKDVAQIFLVYGYLDNIKAILPSLGKGVYLSQFDRLYHTASVDENLPKLLAMYDSDVERLELHALMFMKPSIQITDKNSNHYERVQALAKEYSRVMNPQNMRLLTTVFHIINKGASAQASVLMGDYWKVLEKARPNYFEEYIALALKGEGAFPTSTDGYTMRAYTKYCLLTKSNAANIKWMTNAVNKTFSKTPLHYKAKFFLDSILGAAYETMHELYAEGKDEELKKILPVIRAINSLTAKYDGTRNASYYSRYRGAYYTGRYSPMAVNRNITAFIHNSVGEVKAFEQWKKTVKGKPKSLLLAKRNRLPHAYSTDISILGSIPGEPLNENYIQFFKRLFNNQFYQRYVTEWQLEYDNISDMADRGQMTFKQGLDVYEHIKIDYKVPAFESVVMRDLAHFEARAGNHDKMLSYYQKMHEILLKHPIKNPRSYVRGYLHAIEDFVIAKRYEEVLTFVPKEVKAKFNDGERKRYNESVKDATENLKEKK
ncbi:MAG: tetratricopeptide repeat protein [Akkermansiaceae bacterium]